MEPAIFYSSLPSELQKEFLNTMLTLIWLIWVASTPEPIHACVPDPCKTGEIKRGNEVADTFLANPLTSLVMNIANQACIHETDYAGENRPTVNEPVLKINLGKAGIDSVVLKSENK